jgi:tRNA A-37 threonylcarbamoyl transferase component Bud32
VLWHVTGACPDIAERLRTLRVDSSGVLVKQNSRRRVYYLPASSPDATGHYLKCDHPTSLRYRLRARFWVKAQREFCSAAALAEAGVPVVDCVAWGRRGSGTFLLSRECKGGKPLREAWQTCRSDRGRRAQFLSGLGNFLGAMCRARISHPDLHTENVLVVEANGTFEFVLVDIYGVRVGVRWGRRSRDAILGLAAALGREVTLPESERLMLSVGVSPSEALPEWRRQLWCFFNDQRKRWPGRRRRMLTSSSLCEREENAQGTWLLRPDLSVDEAGQAVDLHRANTAEDRGILKRGSKRQLSRVRVGGRALVVKEFFNVGWRGLWRPDRAAWLNAYRLGLALVPAARCFGWLRARDGNGFLVFEDLGPLTLEHALGREGASVHRLELLSAAGKLTAWLHAARIVHRDLTAANFLVVPGPPDSPLPLKLIDYDRIRLYRRNCPQSRRVHNLVQLFELLLPSTGRRERLRLLAAYRRQMGDDRAAFRRLLEDLETALPGVLMP